MFSLSISMFSLLLFSLSISPLFCDISIANIDVLDNYFGNAVKFMNNRPVFDGITLVIPEQQPQPLPGLTPAAQLVSHMEWPSYQPIFHSRIVQKRPEKYRKPLSSKSSEIHYNKIKRKKKTNHSRNRRKKYPNSIYDRLREQDSEDQSVDEHNPEDQMEPELYDRPFKGPKSERPFDLPEPKGLRYERPFVEPELQKFERPFATPESPKLERPLEKSERQTTGGQGNSWSVKSRPKTSNNTGAHHRKPQNSYNPSAPPVPHIYNSDPESQSIGSPKRPLNLFDALPPYSGPNRFNSAKPLMDNNRDQILSSDSDEKAIEENQIQRPKKQRTATVNQLSHKPNDKELTEQEDNENEEKDEKEENRKLNNEWNGIRNEDLDSNDDPNHYPHQYAIEIRWKDKNNELYDMNGPEGDYDDREMHSSKDYEHARHRLFKHEEEEHWHDKKWLDEGLKKGLKFGRPLPVHIMKPSLKIETNAHYNPLPSYALPLPTGASHDQINQHFAIPTPNFRVNNRFIEWVKGAIDLNRYNKPLNKFIPVFG